MLMTSSSVKPLHILNDQLSHIKPPIMVSCSVEVVLLLRFNTKHGPIVYYLKTNIES